MSRCRENCRERPPLQISIKKHSKTLYTEVCQVVVVVSIPIIKKINWLIIYNWQCSQKLHKLSLGNVCNIISLGTFFLLKTIIVQTILIQPQSQNCPQSLTSKLFCFDSNILPSEVNTFFKEKTCLAYILYPEQVETGDTKHPSTQEQIYFLTH